MLAGRTRPRSGGFIALHRSLPTFEESAFRAGGPNGATLLAHMSSPRLLPDVKAYPGGQSLLEVDVPDADGGQVASLNEPKVNLVYILAASHSGSTLLAMLLGSHRDACTVGELKATSLGNPAEYRCSCGTRIQECTFWREVAAKVADRGWSFDIASAGTHFEFGVGPYVSRLLRPLHRGRLLEWARDAALSLAPGWHTHLNQARARTRVLADAVCELQGARMIIDSSKVGLRLKYLLRDPSFDIRVVRLIRDGRGVALTYTDAGRYADARNPADRGGGTGRVAPEARRSMRAAAREWRRSNEEAEHVLRAVDSARQIEVRYEDLCRHTDETLTRLFRFLDVDPDRWERSFRATQKHVIGNGMRFDTSDEIQLDERWRAILTPSDLAVFDAEAGDMNRRYGYL